MSHFTEATTRIRFRNPQLIQQALAGMGHPVAMLEDGSIQTTVDEQGCYNSTVIFQQNRDGTYAVQVDMYRRRTGTWNRWLDDFSMAYQRESYLRVCELEGFNLAEEEQAGTENVLLVRRY